MCCLIKELNILLKSFSGNETKLKVNKFSVAIEYFLIVIFVNG
jgi:hypothetical protein